MSDELLDLAIAKEVMGWEKSEEFNISTKSSAPLYMPYQGDVLYSEPYQAWEGDFYQHQWHKFSPSANLKQAIEVLDWLKNTGRITDWNLHSGSAWMTSCRISWYSGVDWKHYEYADKSLPRAIVLAVLGAFGARGVSHE